MKTEEAPVSHPSRVYLLTDGPEALHARLDLIDQAERTLELQYYLWHADEAGAVLAERMLAAADRGVRVRVLLDDIDLDGRDAGLLAFHAHPRIEVRLFNPFRRGWLRFFEWLTRFGELNRRMHNKALVSDDVRCVVGGRNIGNEYFGLDPEVAFNDLDIAADGPVALEARKSFDAYWESKRARPVGEVVEPGSAFASGPGAFRAALDFLAARGREVLARQDLAEMPPEARPWNRDAAEAKAQLLADPPEKSWSRRARKRGLATALAVAMESAETEVLIVSPYFVPRRRLLTRLTGLTRRGVKVRVLTNSLASNDVIAVHAGYSPKRPALLRGGVGLFELKPDGGQLRRSGKAKLQFRPSEGRASLHAKLFVIDRKTVFIGSFNLDPRSARLNTEMGILVDCPALACEAAEFAESLMAESNEVGLADNRLFWKGADGNVTAKEPHAGLGLRLLVSLLGCLPIEEHL
ncbi:MAG: phospholipase D-like domain-containing protein [Verrucomicrobiales bacterium]